MLFRETVTVYCRKHTEHTNTVCTSQKTHYISATEPNRLMLFGETVPYGTHRYSSYLTGNTLRLSYREHPVIAVWPQTVSVYCENPTKHKQYIRVHCVRKTQSLNAEQMV
jgi:hypothetical protein